MIFHLFCHTSHTMRSRVSWPPHRLFQPKHRLSSNLQLYMSSNSTKSLRRSSVFDILKPRYHEAVYRLKNSLIALVALFTLTHLLPFPTPYASAWNFYRDSFQSSWEKSLAIAGAIPLYKFALPPLTQDHDGTCDYAELSVFCLLLANIFQATIAIRSPPAPYPPLPSPSKSLSPRSKGATMTPPAWRGKSGGLSPKVRLTPLFNAYTYSWSYFLRAHIQTTPQRQLAFSTTTPAGGSSASAGVGGASDPRGLAQ